MGKLSKNFRKKTGKIRGRVKEFRGEFKFVVFSLLLGALVLLFNNCTKFSPRDAAQLGLNGSNGGPTPQPPNPTPTPTPAPFGLTSRQTLPALPFDQETTSGTGIIEIVPAFPSLSFSQPLFLTHSGDGSDRVFVVEKTGAIRVFDNSSSATTSTVFLDVAARLSSDGGEEGLLGLAFHPNYEANGYFFICYTGPTSGSGMNHKIVVERYQVLANDPNRANAATRTLVLEFDHTQGNHNGGWMGFGQDGFLYISSGDGGGGGDPQGNGQSLTTLMGKMLRIDVNTLPYTIPTSNPFATHATNRREIFAYGLRNPWRASFDRTSGALWVADVGQSEWEEIDIVTNGGNYGWRQCEGNEIYQSSTACPSQYVRPIHTYGRSQGDESITGGYVYRGNLLPSLRGRYIYGDFISGRIWSLNYNGTTVVSNTEIGTFASGLASFGEDEGGELYMTGIGDGRIYKFRETGTTVTPVVPAKLSDTGLFTNVASLATVPGLIVYDVNVPLWSDGALKKRWIGIPGTERIQFNRDTPWVFPQGTIFMKHFVLQTGPTTSKRVETRILYNGRLGWAGYTYRWNSGGTDADIVAPGGMSEDISLGSTTQSWRYPSRTECLTCHTLVAGRALGVNTHQLNMNFAYPTVSDNQLRSWNNIALFTSNIGAHTSLPAYPPWYDLTGNRENLSRAYLAVNCAQCHQPGGTTPYDIDFRYTTPLNLTNLIDVPIEGPILGLIDPSRIRRGDHASSMVWERMNRTDMNRMPPLGTSQPDMSALTVIQQWINSL